jgi:hypothetical protein
VPAAHKLDVHTYTCVHSTGQDISATGSPHAHPFSEIDILTVGRPANTLLLSEAEVKCRVKTETLERACDDISLCSCSILVATLVRSFLKKRKPCVKSPCSPSFSPEGTQVRTEFPRLIIPTHPLSSELLTWIPCLRLCPQPTCDASLRLVAGRAPLPGQLGSHTLPQWWGTPSRGSIRYLCRPPLLAGRFAGMADAVHEDGLSSAC